MEIHYTQKQKRDFQHRWVSGGLLPKILKPLCQGVICLHKKEECPINLVE